MDKGRKPGRTCFFIAEGHRWLQDSRIGIVASIDDDIFCDKNNVTYYNRKGLTWNAPYSAIEIFRIEGWVECSEEEARNLLKKK